MHGETSRCQSGIYYLTCLRYFYFLEELKSFIQLLLIWAYYRTLINFISLQQRFAFTRPEDLPRARAVWESTAQTNLRKSMWEARDKAQKSTGNRDPRAWLDDGPSWLRKDYWQSLCERWAAGPWQQRSQAAIRNRSTHPEKNVHTSGSVSYATHSQKLVSILLFNCLIH